METARTDLAEEISAMEKEVEALLSDVQTTIGDLSDLRTGKFSRTPGSGTDLGEDVLDGLKKLEQLCNDTKNG
jgi:centromere-localized protein 2